MSTWQDTTAEPSSGRGHVERSKQLTRTAAEGGDSPQSHLAGLETTFTALNWSGRLRVRSGVDGGVENTGVKRYRTLSGRHLTTLVAEPRDQDLLLLVAETSQSHVRVAVAVRNHIVRNNAPGEPEWSVVQGTNYGAHELAIDAAAGEQLAIEKIAAFYTSRDRAVSEPSEAAVGELGQAGSFDMLLERHVLAWAHLCQHFHVDLTDGDGISDEALQTVHLHLFHLLQTVSPNSIDLDAGVPARGLHGEAYRGHVFWDELFVLPVLTLRAPASPEPRCAIGTGDYLRRARPPATQDSPVPCIPGSREVTGARRASGCTSTRCPAGGHRRSAICSDM